MSPNDTGHAVNWHKKWYRIKINVQNCAKQYQKKRENEIKRKKMENKVGTLIHSNMNSFKMFCLWNFEWKRRKLIYWFNYSKFCLCNVLHSQQNLIDLVCSNVQGIFQQRTRRNIIFGLDSVYFFLPPNSSNACVPRIK